MKEFGIVSENVFSANNTIVEINMKYVLDKWVNLDKIIQYEYSTHHIEIKSSQKCHYYTFGVNKGNINVYSEPFSCRACSQCVFFLKISKLLSHVSIINYKMTEKRIRMN